MRAFLFSWEVRAVKPGVQAMGGGKVGISVFPRGAAGAVYEVTRGYSSLDLIPPLVIIIATFNGLQFGRDVNPPEIFSSGGDIVEIAY